MKTFGTKSNQTPNQRRGFTLVEMVVVMSIATVIVGIAITIIHLLWRAEQHSAQAVWHNTSIAQLSRELRNDIHAARKATVEKVADGQDSLKLSFENDRRVFYTVEEHELKRIESTGNETTHRNSFFVPVGSTLRFEQSESSVVRLVIERASLVGRPVGDANSHKEAERGRRTLTIEAIVGRDYRFVKGE